MNPDTKADAVMRIAFPPCWPASVAFKSGCRSQLAALLDGISPTGMPYLYGSAEAAQYRDGQNYGEKLAADLRGICCDHAS